MRPAIVEYLRDKETATQLHITIQGVIHELFMFFNQEPNEHIAQSCATTIMYEYSDLSVEDFDMWARTVRAGKVGGAGVYHKYAQPFGKIGGNVIMGWLSDYYDVKSAVREEMRREENQRLNAPPAPSEEEEEGTMTLQEAIERFPNIRKVMQPSAKKIDDMPNKTPEGESPEIVQKRADFVKKHRKDDTQEE